jgi:hypothetical protein
MIRRTFFRALMAASAIPADIHAAHAIPAGISPKLVELIADYQRSAAAFEVIDQDADPSAWDEAGAIACGALKTLLDERPITVAEFTAKFEALIEGTEDDSELYILRTLAADIRALTEGGR